MEYEKVGTVRMRRRPLLMVLARHDGDGTRAVAVKMSRNIRFKRKKQELHKSTDEPSQRQLPWVRGR